LLNSICSSVSPDFRFKETPYVNFFTDPELSSSQRKETKILDFLSILFDNKTDNNVARGYECMEKEHVYQTRPTFNFDGLCTFNKLVVQKLSLVL